jgi:hypothetical protein
MIGTLRKHQQWLWMLIITVVIITFVWFFTPTNQMGDVFKGDQRMYINGAPVTMYGKPISKVEYNKALRETYLGYFMRSGGSRWPDNDEQTAKQLERDTISRILMLKKLEELDIHVSDDAVAQAAHDRLHDFPLAQFEKDYLATHGFTIQDFEVFLRHEVGIQQLFNTAAASGKLFSPQDAEKLFRKEHEQSDTRIAIFWGSNYLDKVTMTDADLTNFYSLRSSQYRVPERVVVSYVEFALTNFLDEADKQIAKNTNFDQKVDEYYNQQGTNAFKGTNGVVLSEADAKKKIKQDFREGSAMIEARKKAAEFGSKLYDLKPMDRAENLASTANKEGLTVKTSPPIEHYSTNEGEFSREFRDAAFKLAPGNPIAFSPVPAEKSYVVMALDKRIASTNQPFEEVKAKVSEDIKRSKAVDLAKAAGNAFYTKLTNGLAEKKTWDQITADAHVETIKPPTFSSVTTAAAMTNLDERIPLQTLQVIAEKMKAGEVSTFEPIPLRMPEGGIIVYMNAKKPVDDATMAKEFPSYLARMRAYRQDEAFKQYFRKMVDQSKLSVAPEKAPTDIGG